MAAGEEDRDRVVLLVRLLLEKADFEEAEEVHRCEERERKEATAAVEESVEDEGLTGALTNANEIAPGATELPAHGNAAAPLTTPKASTAGTPHEKLGRNDPCWCGSKRKFKQCHGRP